MVALAAFSFPPAPASPRPPPVDLIRVITGTEKIYPKQQQHSSS